MSLTAEPLAAEPIPLALDADGVFRVAGTRVTLETVLSAYKRGGTPEQIAQDYPSLEPADIYAVITYYLRHRSDVDTYLERRREQSVATRRKFEKIFSPEGVRARLESRLRRADRRAAPPR